MALNIKPILNVNGEARIEFALANGGLGKIKYIAIGRGQYHPTGTEVALVDEVARAQIETVTPQDGFVEVTATITCPEDFTASELAFLLEDGTPFSIHSEDPARQYPDLDPVTGEQREDGNGNPLSRAGMPLATLREGTEVPFRYVIDVEVYGPDKITVSPQPLNEAYTLQGRRVEVLEAAMLNPKHRTSGDWAQNTISLFVDPLAGDDQDDGLGWLSPKKTPLGAWWSLPPVIFHQTRIILKAETPHLLAPLPYTDDVFSGRPSPLHLSGRVCGPRTTRVTADDNNLTGVVIRGENKQLFNGAGVPILDETSTIIEAPAGGYGGYVTGCTEQVGMQDLLFRPAAGAVAEVLLTVQRDNRAHLVRCAGLGDNRATYGLVSESDASVETFETGFGGAIDHNYVAFAESKINIIVGDADPVAGAPATGDDVDFWASGEGAKLEVNASENGFQPTGTARFSEAATATYRGRSEGEFPDFNITTLARSASRVSLFSGHLSGVTTLNAATLTAQDGAIEARVFNDGGLVSGGKNLRISVDLPASSAITNSNGGRFVDTIDTTIFTGTSEPIKVAERDPGGNRTVGGNDWFINIGDAQQHMEVSGGTQVRTGAKLGHSTFSVKTIAGGFTTNEDVSIGGAVIGTVKTVDGDWVTIRMNATTPAIPEIGVDLTGADSAHVSAIDAVNPLTSVGMEASIECRSWPVTLLGTTYYSGDDVTFGDGSGQERSVPFYWDGDDWRRKNWSIA